MPEIEIVENVMQLWVGKVEDQITITSNPDPLLVYVEEALEFQ